MSAVPDIRRNDEGDGLVSVVHAHDGAEIELQLLDEQSERPGHPGRSRHTWELLWSRGTETTLHHLSLTDVRGIAAVLVAFADCVEAKGGRP